MLIKKPEIDNLYYILVEVNRDPSVKVQCKLKGDAAASWLPVHIDCLEGPNGYFNLEYEYRLKLVEVPEDYERPVWDDTYLVHDWKNHITADVRHLWNSFSVIQRQAIAQQAAEAASREEWD